MKEYFAVADVKKELHKKCVELFQSIKVAEEIYLDLIHGIDKCEVYYLNAEHIVDFDDPRP